MSSFDSFNFNIDLATVDYEEYEVRKGNNRTIKASAQWCKLDK